MVLPQLAAHEIPVGKFALSNLL